MFVPKPIYEALPAVYVGGGLVTTTTAVPHGNLLLFVSGAILLLAAAVIIEMRAAYRGASNYFRNR